MSSEARLYRAYVVALSTVLCLVFPLGLVAPDLSAPRYWQFVLSPLLLLGLWRARRDGTADGSAAALSPRVLRFFGAAVLAFCLSVQSVRYLAFDVNGVDFSIFDWMLYDTNHGAFGYSPIYGVDHFGVHATWILLVLAPLHRVFESHGFLVMVTALALAFGARVLFRFARREGFPDAHAVLLVLAYLTTPFTAVLLDGGFRPEIFFPPVGLAFLSAWSAKRARLWIPALVLFLAIKEDAALYVAAFAVAVVLFERPRWRPALAMFVAAVGLFILNVGVLQPRLLQPYGLTQPGYVAFWGQYGKTLPEIARSMLGSPLRLGRDLVTSGWWKLFLPALFLPALSPVALLPMLPTVFLLGSASYGSMHRFSNYYPAAALPFLFYGFVLARERFAQVRWLERLRPYRDGIFVFALLLFPLNGGNITRLNPPKWEALRVTRAFAETNTPVRAQTVFFPHLPYAAKVIPYVEPERPNSPDASHSHGGVPLLVAPGLDPWPWTHAQLHVLVDRAVQEHRAMPLGAGIFLVTPSD